MFESSLAMRTLLIKACALLLLTGCTTIGGSSDRPRAVALADGVYMLPGSGGAADEKCAEGRHGRHLRKTMVIRARTGPITWRSSASCHQVCR